MVPTNCSREMLRTRSRSSSGTSFLLSPSVMRSRRLQPRLWEPQWAKAEMSRPCLPIQRRTSNNFIDFVPYLTRWALVFPLLKSRLWQYNTHDDGSARLNSGPFNIVGYLESLPAVIDAEIICSDIHISTQKSALWSFRLKMHSHSILQLLDILIP